MRSWELKLLGVALVSLLGAAIPVGQPAQAAPPTKLRPMAEQRESLVMLLSAYEPEFRKAVFDTIGPDVPRLLVDIANHPKERATVRTRAVAALANYPNENTRAYLLGLLHERSLMENDLGLLMRSQALRTLGKAFGDGEVENIAALKNDRSQDVRAAVAHALGDSRSKKARLILETWLEQETNLAVKLAVDKALQRLRGF
jgi:HEAT repeat protein